MLHPIVLGTAGHIDHGKSSLVKLLTGIDPDRLHVEKARGITTELGFAPLTLNGRRVAIVDVPGHERFVKSMVAGASGMDLVMMVIAADEGVMPQTREHIAICDLLRVRRGLIVLSKADLVDDEWLALIKQELQQTLAGSFLETAPVIAVSARTGDGLDRLRDTLHTVMTDIPPRPSVGVPRLPIDRVFTVKGFGTVATGTLSGGELTTGDELVVLPSSHATRVRGLEVHREAVAVALPGSRVAVNVLGLAVDQIERGDVLCRPGQIEPSHIIDVELRYLAANRTPLRHRTKVLVHHGTGVVLGTVHLVNDQELAPGAACVAQLRLSVQRPLVAIPGDAFILRGFAPTQDYGSTIGGGVVIRVHAPKARQRERRERHAQIVRDLATASLDRRIAMAVQSSSFAGLGLREIVHRIGIEQKLLAAPLATLVGSGELLALGDGDHKHYLHAAAVVELEAAIMVKLSTLSPIHRESLRSHLSSALPQRAFDAVLDGLARRGALLCDGDQVAKRGELRAPLSPIETRIVNDLKGWGLEPLRPKEMAAHWGLTEPEVKRCLDKLVAAKLAVKIKPDLYMHEQIVAGVRTGLIQFLAENSTIDAQQWKQLTGASRKFTIPLAEFFDAEKLTLRVGDIRRKR